MLETKEHHEARMEAKKMTNEKALSEKETEIKYPSGDLTGVKSGLYKKKDVAHAVERLKKVLTPLLNTWFLEVFEDPKFLKKDHVRLKRYLREQIDEIFGDLQ